MFDPNDNKYDTFGKVSPGAHILRITKAEVTKSQSGNDMIECTFTVIGDDPDKGTEIPWNYFVIKDNSLWKLAEMCRSLHPKVGPFDPRSQQEVNTSVLGKIFVGHVIHYEEKYDGQMRTKVKVDQYLYPDDKIIKAAGAYSGGGQAPAGGGGNTHDDIPF